MRTRTARRATSELSSALSMFSTAQFSTAVQQINYPFHDGRPNDAHGKFFFVGSIPADCYDESRNGGRGGSRIYDTEDLAIRAAIAGGATRIQGADCRFINPADYL